MSLAAGGLEGCEGRGGSTGHNRWDVRLGGMWCVQVGGHPGHPRPGARVLGRWQLQVSCEPRGAGDSATGAAWAAGLRLPERTGAPAAAFPEDWCAGTVMGGGRRGGGGAGFLMLRRAVPQRGSGSFRRSSGWTGRGKGGERRGLCARTFCRRTERRGEGRFGSRQPFFLVRISLREPVAPPSAGCVSALGLYDGGSGPYVRAGRR